MATNSFSELLKRSNLTQRQLADLLGISPEAIGHWLAGRRSPRLTIPQLKIMCEALAITEVKDLPDSFAR